MCRDLNRDLRLLYESGPSDLTAYGLGYFLWVQGFRFEVVV